MEQNLEPMTDERPQKDTGRDTDSVAAVAATRSPAESDAAARVYPFHPFLLAPASVVTLNASNVKQASFLLILPALGAVLGFALCVVLTAALLCRTFGARTPVLAEHGVLTPVRCSAVLLGGPEGRRRRPRPVLRVRARAGGGGSSWWRGRARTSG